MCEVALPYCTIRYTVYLLVISHGGSYALKDVPNCLQCKMSARIGFLWYFCFRIVFLLASLAWSTANWSYLYIEHARNTYDNSFATDWQASLRFMAGSENLAGFYMFIVQRIFLKGQPSLYLALLCRLSWFVSGHCFGISQGQVLVGTRVKSCIEQGYMRSVEVWWS